MFPAALGLWWDGRLSLDQVGVIGSRAGDGSDEQHVSLVAVAMVSQLRTRSAWNRAPQLIPSRTATAEHKTAEADFAF